MEGEALKSACSVAVAGPLAIAFRRAGCDEGSGQLIDGVGINEYLGSVNLLNIRRREYVEWCAFGMDFPSIKHDQPIAVLGS